MIDTIQIGNKEFEILEGSKLTKKVFINLETGEATETFFYNDELLNLSIDSRGLVVKTTFSKLYGLGDFNFYPLGKYSFETCIGTLEKKLYDIGIITDLDKSKILRLDIFRNVETSYSYQTYEPILQTLNLKRTHSQIYPEGYLMKNGLKEVMFYNKVKELAKKLSYSYVRQLGFNSENIIRGEVRLLKHKEVKKQLGIEYLKEIPEGWNLLKETHKKFMQEIFKYEGGEVVQRQPSRQEIELAIQELAVMGKRALIHNGLGIYSLASKEEVKKALGLHYTRQQVYNILQSIEKDKKETQELFSSLNNKELYEELRSKFLEG